MKVVRARVLGFCMGVRRAVDLACGAVENSAGRVYTLGPLIHNPQALEELKSRGVEILDEHNLPQNLHNASVIIRAHGVSPQTEAELRRRGAALIDATCPRVKASQLKAAALAEVGCRLFLAGEEHHAEVIGIRGYAQMGALRKNASPDTVSPGEIPFCAIVGSAVEAEKAAAQLHNENPDAQTALIGQTTISAEEYQAIGEAITRVFPRLEIAQTICPATRERQDSLRDLLGAVDAIIVAGGKESANTRRLLTVAETAGIPCAIVETAADIPRDFSRFGVVGLTAGASTPDASVDAIERGLGVKLLQKNRSNGDR